MELKKLVWYNEFAVTVLGIIVLGYLLTKIYFKVEKRWKEKKGEK